MSNRQYLSPAWFERAQQVLAEATFETESPEPVSFAYSITDLPADHPDPGPTIDYSIVITPGDGATLQRTSERADVRFTMSYDVAERVSGGSYSGSKAFLDGEIRLGGSVAVLIERAGELKNLEAVLGGSGDA